MYVCLVYIREKKEYPNYEFYLHTFQHFFFNKANPGLREIVNHATLSFIILIVQLYNEYKSTLAAKQKNNDWKSLPPKNWRAQGYYL